MSDILFEPIVMNTKYSRRPRYYFEPDEIEIAKIVDCDCDRCLVTSSEPDYLTGWSIFDAKKGHRDPIAFCEDAGEAQKIVDALNA